MIVKQKQQAARFGEACPIGNGQMGAMVYGSFPAERLILTENTFYSGRKSGQDCKPRAKEAFSDMRALLQHQEFEKAHKVAENFHGVRNDYGTNLPFGELTIQFPSGGVMSQYQRSLDITQGIAQTVFYLDKEEGKNGNRVQTEALASHPDHVLVWNMNSGKALDLVIGFQPYHNNGGVSAAEYGFFYTAKARETIHCDVPCGVNLYGCCSLVTDGTWQLADQKLHLAAATNVTLYLICETDYLQKMNVQEAGQEAEQESEQDPEQKIRNRLERRAALFSKMTYKDLKNRHCGDVSRLMNRVELHLEGSEQAELLTELFQYGRYLLVSSSREDSILPAHLQGIWNDDVACRIGWSCDMHLDINTQMNYWIADMTDLGEVLPPLCRFAERLAKRGEQSAGACYGMPGWSAELVTNAWCYSAPYWAVPIAPYPTGGAWLILQLMEHYEYTGDQEFLRWLYPLLEGSVRFFAAYVFEEDGMLGCGPSISAENSFVKDQKTYQISNSCTYEVTIIRELFRDFIRASKVLKKESELSEKVCRLLPKLPEFRILSDGTIGEWAHDLPAEDAQHRHTSHLLGLYPLAQITPELTPKLADAAQKTIQAKLTPYENWEDTGWARSLLILYEARLHQGEKAWFHVKSMVDNLREPNSMIYHPPTRGTVFDDDFGHVYELDGNTGLTAGICEMLLQSHNGVIRLLPAVPEKWADGEVKGLKARNGVSVRIGWKEGVVTEFELFSADSQRCRIFFNKRELEIFLEASVPFIWKTG